MEWPDYFADDEPSPIRRQLQGPRPTPLRVSKDSYKIKKPPLAPQPSHPQPHPHPPPPAPAADRQPVIIYAVSPKVIHTTVDDFMNLVQRLTGPYSSSSPSSGAVSPAARLASIEKTSPIGREKERDMATDLMGMIEGVEMGQNVPGILSPAPASLPPIPPGYFSPGSDQNNPFIIASNMYIPSPSTLFSAPMASPSPGSYDLLRQFMDF